jgi:ferredoxin
MMEQRQTERYHHHVVVMPIRLLAVVLTTTMVIQSSSGFSPLVDPSWRSYCYKRFVTKLGAQRSPTSVDIMSRYSSSCLTEIQVTVPKPMGLILEEIDPSRPEAGICIAKIYPDGAVAGVCRSESCPDIAIRDKILSVDGTQCAKASLEEVMDLIANSEAQDSVSLTLGRIKTSIKVTWPNGVSIAAFPGEYLGNLAYDALYDIAYECRSGSCGTCEQGTEMDESGEIRFVRPCVARIPKGKRSIRVYETRSR